MAATAIIRMPDEGVHVRFGGTRMTFPGISNDTRHASILERTSPVRSSTGLHVVLVVKDKQTDASAEKPINTPAPSPVSAGVQHEITCQYYAMNTKKAADANRRRSCGGTGARWTLNIDDHMAWCRSQHGDMRIPDQETKARSDALAACGNRSGTGDNGAGGGSQTMSVVSGNTMYDTYRQPNKGICDLHTGDTLTALPSDENADKWLRLSGNSGDCNGKTGYVWNDSEVK